MNWIKNHLIFMWAMTSIVFAVIVHLLFSFRAPFDGLVAKWSAGDLLTYASTVSLGLLALWQNNKFKAENDTAQTRIETLTKQSNDINIINKIIEFEADNLRLLRITISSFLNICNPAELISSYGSNIDDSFSALIVISKTKENILYRYNDLLRILRQDSTLINDDDTDSIFQAAQSLYNDSNQLVQHIINHISSLEESNEIVSVIPEDYSNALKSSYETFYNISSSYIYDKEQKLYAIIYNNLSIEQIKELYCINIENPPK